MVDFGLVTEGITDQAVIENILYGYFENPDLLIQPLQPDRDKDAFGGCDKVFEYCESQEFIEALGSHRYIIIHIDTDIAERFGISIYENEKDLTVKALRDRVIAKFQEIIGKECHNFQYEEYKDKFIFAIAIHSIECWLLPLHCKEDKKAEQIKGCYQKLEKCLQQKIHKNQDYYDEISAKYSKPKELKKNYTKNPSFRLFVEELQNREINF